MPDFDRIAKALGVKADDITRISGDTVTAAGVAYTVADPKFLGLEDYEQPAKPAGKPDA